MFTIVLHLLSFQNSLKTSGYRGYEFLEFWCWNLVPFLPDIGFQLLKSLWSSLMFFSFNDAANVLGERSGLQTGQFSTRTLLLRSHAIVVAAVCGFTLSCWNIQGLPWNRHHLEGSIYCSKTFIYLSAFIVPSKTCKLPILCALMHPHTIRDAGFWTERWWHAGRSPSSLARGTRRPWFPTRMSNLDSSDHRTLFHFETVHFKLACHWPTEHDGASGPCSHMASFLHERALVGICRWHGGLCLPTVVSGSIPGPI